MEQMQTQEMISALVDGQLPAEAFARGVEAAAADSSAREAWHNYHLIGDVLRGGTYAGGTAPAVFLGRLQLSLQQEQGVARIAHGLPVAMRAVEAANDTTFRWKMVAGVASLAAVAAVGWSVVGGLAGQPEQAQLAAVPAAAATTLLAESERGVMIRDARLDEFLAAHKQLGGASALQMPAGFLRNATFEGPIR